MSRRGWSWLSCCLTLALAPGEPFLDLSYEQALARSKEQGKLLLVDATASWCPPCKRMEKETWPTEPVRTWLAAHAVTIQIDVDEERELARSLKIEAMPTVIAFKDGIEFDRNVGFADTADLLAWLDDVLAGKPSNDVVREKAVVPEAGSDVGSHYNRARALLQQHDYASALEEYLWLWPNSRGLVYGGVRLSFMLDDVRQLCDAYAPARRDFDKLLDALDAKVQKRTASADDWLEWLALSSYLEDDRRVLAFLAEHPLSPRPLDVRGATDSFEGLLADQIFGVLLEHQQFVDAGRMVPDLGAKARSVVRDSRAERERIRKTYAKKVEMNAKLQEFERSNLGRTLAQLHAAALALDKPEQAQMIGALLLREFDDENSRIALVTAALAAGRAGAEHQRWLDEAEQLGASVGDLRAKLPPLDAPPPDDGG